MPFRMKNGLPGTTKTRQVVDGLPRAAKLLSYEEARRIAVNIAKLPDDVGGHVGSIPTATIEINALDF
jgi:hypothetical protein